MVKRGDNVHIEWNSKVIMGYDTANLMGGRLLASGAFNSKSGTLESL